MAAYRRVYDSRHLQADGLSSGTLRSAIEYGLPLPFTAYYVAGVNETLHSWLP